MEASCFARKPTTNNQQPTALAALQGQQIKTIPVMGRFGSSYFKETSLEYKALNEVSSHFPKRIGLSQVGLMQKLRFHRQSSLCIVFLGGRKRDGRERISVQRRSSRCRPLKALAANDDSASVIWQSAKPEDDSGDRLVNMKPFHDPMTTKPTTSR
jgi:hypothetical protein